MKNVVLPVIGILIGTVLSFLITKYSEAFIPSDFTRTKVLLDSLPSIQCDIILFGNSSPMNGIDTRLLDKKTRNFCSSGQGLKESFLLYQEVNKNVEQVYQFVDVRDLVKNGGILFRDETVLNYITRGYERSKFTKVNMSQRSDSIFENTTLNQEWKFQRALFQSGVNTFFRNWFTGDRKAVENQTSLTAPFVYENNLPEKEVTQLIIKHQPKISDVILDLEKIKIITQSKKYFEKRGVEYRLILNPVHPKMKALAPNFYTEVHEKMKRIDFIEIADFSGLLEVEEFVDHVHANEAGRIKMSTELNKLMND